MLLLLGSVWFYFGCASVLTIYHCRNGTAGYPSFKQFVIWLPIGLLLAPLTALAYLFALLFELMESQNETWLRKNL
jgi:hypothetical protein